MNEIQNLEHYLLDHLPAGERLVMEAKILLNKELRENAHWQKQTYTVIQHYGRKNLKAEIEAVHKRLFTEKKFDLFKQNILNIFKK